MDGGSEERPQAAGDETREALFSRLRDAEDARKAAVGLLRKQNEELVRLKGDLRALEYAHRALAEDAGKDQAVIARVRAWLWEAGAEMPAVTSQSLEVILDSAP